MVSEITGRTAVPSPGEIVKAARERQGLTQVTFAKAIGRSQTEVSRYESGQVDPPGGLLMHCLQALGVIGAVADVSAEDLAFRIRSEFSSPNKESTRAAVWQLLDVL